MEPTPGSQSTLRGMRWLVVFTLCRKTYGSNFKGSSLVSTKIAASIMIHQANENSAPPIELKNLNLVRAFQCSKLSMVFVVLFLPVAADADLLVGV